MRRFINKVFHKLITLNSYEVSAAEYAKNTEDLYPQEEAQLFSQMLGQKAKIIDIGCGPGRDVKKFLDLGLNVVGIDFSFKMIEMARKNAPKGEFHIMDIESLDFPSNAFDGAWANCSLLHIPKKNISLVFSKIYHILKLEGLLYLAIKHYQSSEVLAADTRYNGLEKFWSFFEKQEIMNILSGVGFKIIDVKVSHKSCDYQTHPIIKIFAKK